MNRLTPFLDSPAAVTARPDAEGLTVLPAGVSRTIRRDKLRALTGLARTWIVRDLATGTERWASVVAVLGRSGLSDFDGSIFTTAALELRD